MIRPEPILVYCDASFVPDGRAGAGYVAFHGDRIAYGGCALRDVDDIDPAELAGAGAAVAFALDAFPEARELLLTTDNNKVQSIPAGPSAEGYPSEHDPSGVLGLCRERGVVHAVRWWPGHARGPEAAGFAGNVAHALSVLGRRRGHLAGMLAGGPGWRSRLAAAVGPRYLDEALRDEGLDLDEACAIAGIEPDTARALVRAGHLATDPRGGLALSSVVAVRDEAERLGHVDFGPDDLGEAELAFRALPSVGAIHASAGMGESFVGTCLVRESAEGLALVSWSRMPDPAVHPAHDPVCDVLDRIAATLSQRPMPGVVDLFLADTLACKAAVGNCRPAPGIAAAGARLDAVLAATGTRLRVHVAKSKRFDGDGGRGAPRTIQAACRIGMAMAHAGHPQVFSMPADAPLDLYGEIARRSAELGLRSTLAAQEVVTAAAFAAVPHEGAAIDAFTEIARAFHTEYRGYALLRWSLLPRPAEDGGMRVVKGDRVKAPFGTWKAPNHLLEAWAAWCERFAGLLDANPVLRLHDPFAAACLDPDEPEFAIAA